MRFSSAKTQEDINKLQTSIERKQKANGQVNKLRLDINNSYQQRVKVCRREGIIGELLINGIHKSLAGQAQGPTPRHSI